MSVIAVQNIKTTYGISRISWQGDPCVPQQFIWDGLNCSNTDITTPPRIIHLNLSSSGLIGTITDVIQNLTLLETLDLSNNNLIGEVPDFLGNMKSLVFINISMNDLSGLIPQALQSKGLELFSQGNPRLCLSGSCLPPKPKPFPVAIVASVASVAIIIVAVLVLTFVLRKKRPSIVGAQQRQPSISSVNVTYTNSPVSSIQTNKRSFTYSEVLNMTNNFQRVVGEGGFGIVYHGTLYGYEQVAVKLLSQSSTQGYKQFKAEVDLLMRVHHTNLVNLVGYCNEGDHLALIYEFVSNGDLRQHLTGKGGRSIINWSIRLQIAVDAASGLEYLHIGCIPPMVHRDVKTTNILLDEQFKARLADFGLSRSFPVGDESHVSMMIAGTPGYLDPEYYRTNRLTEKSDVYSFGIVLLEMITNQPVIDQSREKSHITEWVGLEVNSGDIRSIMDPNLQEDYDSDSAWRIFDLAMSCVNPSSKRRPSMSQVVVELKECLESEKSRRNMSRGRMDSHRSAEVTVLVDTEMFPIAR
ncbi:probable LRR receptor-like serine/threonine-protein kinase At5g59680 isoform X3 [Brassica rapa]|uniref:probable LRR receptor-like serine/threonine-protein kinase At5g59680 isoform X3 n=1 Tax=Brassica campestris TaxID=3711 RepID=UPI00142D588C|nr:probable LRR receptor-like serine/threonine-protein kinase At5g59680 isoform X3 [Brassica rapa]